MWKQALSVDPRDCLFRVAPGVWNTAQESPMLKSIEGVLKDGKVELLEPVRLRGETPISCVPVCVSPILGAGDTQRAFYGVTAVL